jgi:hypothetical protein
MYLPALTESIEGIKLIGYYIVSKTFIQLIINPYPKTGKQGYN